MQSDLTIGVAGRISENIDANAASLAEQRSDVIARLERLPFSPFHFRVTAILSVGTIFDAFDAICIATALTVIFTSLHIGFFNAGLLFSSAYVGQFLGAWAFGFISESYGRKTAFVSALFLFGVLSMATALTWDLQSLVAMRMIQGLGLGGEIPAAAVLLNELLRSQKRGRIAMIYQTMFQWGAMLTPIIGIAFFNLFGQQLGWRLMFLFGGIPALVAVYAWFRLPELPRWLADRGRYREADAILHEMEAESGRTPLAPPDRKPAPPLERTRFGELFAGIYLRRTVTVWVGWTCAYFVAYGFSLWLPTLYVKVGGLPVNDALALSIVPWIIHISAIYIGAFLVDRIGRKPLLVFGYVAMALGGFGGALVVYAWHAMHWQVLFTVAIMLGIGTSLCTVAIIPYTAELYPTRLRGIGVSVASSMNRLASIFAPSAVGALMAANLGIQSVFTMFGVAGLIGALVLATIGIETKQQTLETLSP